MKFLQFLELAHVICLLAAATFLYRRWGRLVTALRPQHSLAAKASAALIFALLAWGSVCSVGSSMVSNHPSRAALAKQIAQIHAALAGIRGRRSGLDVSAAAVLEITSDEPRPAEASDFTALPEPALVVTQCSTPHSNRPVRIILAPSPDHLIELPGTPPPSAV